ncbi:MAG TPA: GrpB family protein [Lacibacter sp.]|nr:GrpB family protein [Lacibacter sp.]
MLLLLEPYNPVWITQFEKIRKELLTILQDMPLAVEHVGSTSVTNLDAKPIIDIDIIYFHLTHFEKIKSRLELSGYYHNGNQGIPDREVFKRNGKQEHEILDTINHHLYACPLGSKALERHILLRNYLRKNEWARVKYQQLKYEIAEMANQNRKLYAELKELYSNDFIDSVIEEERKNGYEYSNTGS